MLAALLYADGSESEVRLYLILARREREFVKVGILGCPEARILDLNSHAVALVVDLVVVDVIDRCFLGGDGSGVRGGQGLDGGTVDLAVSTTDVDIGLALFCPQEGILQINAVLASTGGISDAHVAAGLKIGTFGNENSKSSFN